MILLLVGFSTTSCFDLSGFGSAGVSPVILRVFTSCKSTGETPALPKTNPATMKGVILVPDMYRREKCSLAFPSCAPMIFAAAYAAEINHNRDNQNQQINAR
jgi:hypothetical protein